MNDRGILASYLLSPLCKITNSENTTQFKLVKDSNSNRILLICYYTAQYQLLSMTIC